ncbi:MAG TPA: tetratricopeptide repeat protein [Verrucomicrobiae bacterium]|jgi:tetratricopeptide (TPR) repeat protein|nr:tetratricopeptide repeat protein [Verrucomicrobiae bacterium]
MHSPIAYILVTGAGLLLAHFLTGDPDARRLRLLQLILVPAGFVAAFAALPDPSNGSGSIGSLMLFFVIIGGLGILLAPNIGHFFGATLTNFLDPQDWTPAEEEIALRPIVKLIDKYRYQDAFAELEKLLKKHKPTYEALNLRAKLLNHSQRFDETTATLLQMLRLSHTAEQQLIVMELLSGLDAHKNSTTRTPVLGVREIRLAHELVLFQADAAGPSDHKAILAGSHRVQDVLVGRHCWLVLEGESWGNDARYWDAVAETNQPTRRRNENGLLQRIAKIPQALKRKNWRQSKQDSRAHFKSALQFIRQEDWGQALPLLQQASAADPHNYEIAYRLVQTAFRVGPSCDPIGTLKRVLVQSGWTEDEERMLRQLKG